MLVEDKNHRVELEPIYKMQMAKCFLSIEIGNTESFASVAPSCFGLAEGNKPVRPNSTQRENNCHLSSLGKQDLTKICKELTERFVMNWLQEMQNKTEKRKSR